MKKKQTISPWQMTSLFLSYMLGSAIINIPSPLTETAKSGAWLSLIISNSFGMLLLMCVFFIHSKYPGHTFIEYSQKVLGKWFAVCISIPITLLFLLNLAFIVIDIGGFFSDAILKDTPTYMINSFILIVAALTVRCGIEVMARMFVLLLIVMISVTLIVFVLAAPFYQAAHLVPVMPDGIKPILNGAYLTFSFPYIELIGFSLFLPFVSKEQRSPLKKYLFVALLVHGLLLILSTICAIMAFGPLSGTIKYSVFSLSQLINIRDIVERIESVIGMALVSGSYMKTTIILFFLKELLSNLLKLKDKRIMIFPVAFIGFLLSVTMYETETEFAAAVFVIWPVFIFTVLTLPLLFVTLLAAIKGKQTDSKY